MDAAHWDERYAKAELEWGTDPNHFLVQEIDGMEPGRALDLAAGEGRNAVWLAALERHRSGFLPGGHRQGPAPG